jgi:hypothetical protein
MGMRLLQDGVAIWQARPAAWGYGCYRMGRLYGRRGRRMGLRLLQQDGVAMWKAGPAAWECGYYRRL